MGVVKGEGGQKGIIKNKGQHKGSTKRYERGEWRGDRNKERQKNEIWSVTIYCTSITNASYPDADSYEGFQVFPCI